MTYLELLAPARDCNIGIAAIDCGADAVYLAGPNFGARQAAGNEIEDIRKLCSYAHRFGARVFVTMNTIFYDTETGQVNEMMDSIREAGADAIIVQDLGIVSLASQKKGWKDFPLHASTQCAIRTPEQAAFLESLGFSRLILERELSLEQIRSIRNATGCELEFFVHGALCVCYSGQCYLSEHLSGRSANRGACIQACRSKYDLVDETGKVLVRDKALLSLKDFNLIGRLEDLAEEGISSFKIEGRLKGESYVRNVVRAYSEALDRLVEAHPEKYARASYGKIISSFKPDLEKTFNRGYTELFLDATKGKWACPDATKFIGEKVGTVVRISPDRTRIVIKPIHNEIRLSNGDGFSFIGNSSRIEGFRADVCNGLEIKCKPIASLTVGTVLYRNNSTSFEKEIASSGTVRRIAVSVNIGYKIDGHSVTLTATALTEDSRSASVSETIEYNPTRDERRMEELYRNQIGKSVSEFEFSLCSIEGNGTIPFVSTSLLNGLRRHLAELLSQERAIAHPLYVNGSGPRITGDYHEEIADYKANCANSLSREVYLSSGAESVSDAFEKSHLKGAELMRSKYCIRHELGMCARKKKSGSSKLYLRNNGRLLELVFDCTSCEMVVKAAD